MRYDINNPDRYNNREKSPCQRQGLDSVQPMVEAALANHIFGM